MSIVLNQSNPETTDSFGVFAIAGNFNGSGADDLVVSAPREDLFFPLVGSTLIHAGAIDVFTGSTAGLNTTSSQTFHQNYGSVEDVAETGDGFGSRLAVGDFNGDGRDDLAVGVMAEDLGNIVDAGAVQIFNGTANGLTDASTPLFHQSPHGLIGIAEAEDKFGSALVAADFNGDGKDDLAVGVSGEDLYIGINSYSNAGAVNILYGSNTGLSLAGNQFFHQNSPDIRDSVETGDNFGRTLTAGDYNGDGYADLAVGSIDSVGSVSQAGAVNVLYGSAHGLTAANNQLWTQNTPGVKDEAEAHDQFGSSLASGDFDGNGKDDLAIGIMGEDIDGVENAGAVSVIYGSSNGLKEQSDDFFHQGVSGIQGNLETGDLFGFSLGVGDFNGDGYEDLAIGSIGEEINGVYQAGAVNILYGSDEGLTATGSQFLHQGLATIDGAAGVEYNFGHSLSVGDFNNDGYADLGIGAPGTNVYGNSAAGSVYVIFGSANGLVA